MVSTPVLFTPTFSSITCAAFAGPRRVRQAFGSRRQHRQLDGSDGRLNRCHEADARSFLDELLHLALGADVAERAFLLRRSSRMKLPTPSFRRPPKARPGVLITRNTRRFSRKHARGADSLHSLKANEESAGRSGWRAGGLPPFGQVRKGWGQPTLLGRLIIEKT